MVTEFVKLYDKGHYSPLLTQSSKLEPGTLLTDPVDDEERINFLRAAVLNANKKVKCAKIIIKYPQLTRVNFSGGRNERR